MIQDVAAVVGVAVVVLPILCYLLAACWKSFKAFKKVTEIADQFKPNGGSTLVDKLASISIKLDTMIATNDVSMNLVSYPVFKADSSGYVYWGNRQFSHETGLNESEFSGLGWLNIVIEEERYAVKTIWLDAVSDARSVTIEFDLEDGRYVTLDALPIKSSKGLEGMLGTLRIERGFCDG